MANEDYERHKGISQTVIAGTLNAPWLFTSLLLTITIMLGYAIAKIESMTDSNRKMEMRVELLNNSLQTLSAVMIRDNILNPDDIKMGPNNPMNKATQNERR